MLYKFRHSLLKIDSKYMPTTGNQKKSHRQTNSASLVIGMPFHRTQYLQQAVFPYTIPEWDRLPETVATAVPLASFECMAQSHPLLTHSNTYYF